MNTQIYNTATSTTTTTHNKGSIFDENLVAVELTHMQVDKEDFGGSLTGKRKRDSPAAASAAGTLVSASAASALAPKNHEASAVLKSSKTNHRIVS